jgi:hypothetical protein
VAPDSDAGRPPNWYGWQTLLAVFPFDVAMVVGLARNGATGGTEALTTGLIGRSVAPAIVHLAHGRPGTAFGSIGLHAGMTAAGMAIGYGLGIALENHNCPPIDPCRNSFVGIPNGPIPGAVAGSMSATILDVVFFGYRQKLSWTASAPQPPVKTAWTMTPFAAPSGAGMAAAGTF